MTYWRPARQSDHTDWNASPGGRGAGRGQRKGNPRHMRNGGGGWQENQAWPAEFFGWPDAAGDAGQWGGYSAATDSGTAEDKKDSEAKAASQAELLLDALAPGSGEVPHAARASSQHNALWPEVEARQALGDEASAGFFTPQTFLGQWLDSLGNRVHVLSTDAYDVRLMATLSRPSRPDVQLHIKPVQFGGGWQCGHSMLDPLWSKSNQLHWVTADGRVSVWIRPDVECAFEDGSADAVPPPFPQPAPAPVPGPVTTEGKAMSEAALKLLAFRSSVVEAAGEGTTLPAELQSLKAAGADDASTRKGTGSSIHSSAWSSSFAE